LKVYIINSITKSYILNIKIRPLVTEYALMIKLMDGASSAHSFNPYAYFGHSWSYFDIQNLRLVLLYILWLEDSNWYLRLWTMSHTIYAHHFKQTIIHQHVHLRRESQSHAPAHVLMRLYPIDKSLVCSQSERRTSC
jgi:hypothetical protein